MFRLFGKAKKMPTPSETIARLRETVDILEKRENYLQKKIEREIDFARKNASKNRRGESFLPLLLSLL
jgi:charged multivesicular body protein 4